MLRPAAAAGASTATAVILTVPDSSTAAAVAGVPVPADAAPSTKGQVAPLFNGAKAFALLFALFGGVGLLIEVSLAAAALHRRLRFWFTKFRKPPACAVQVYS